MDDKKLFYYLCFKIMIIFLVILLILTYVSQVKKEQEGLIAKINKLELKNKQLERDNYILKREIKENKEDE